MKPVLILIPAAFLWAAAVEIPASKIGNFVPLPEAVSSPANPTTPEKVALGRMLYFDARLSLSQKVSCNSCHDLAKYGVDNGPPRRGTRPARRQEFADCLQCRRATSPNSGMGAPRTSKRRPPAR